MKTAGIIIFIFLMFFTLNLYGNNALEFNGITDYASIPDDDLFDVAAVTIELWFYWDGSGTDVDFLTAKSSEELEIHLGGSTSNGIRFIPTTSVWIDTPAEAFTPGSWVHVACVYDPSQSLGQIYINGNDMGAVNNGSNPLTTAIVHSDSDFRLGLRGNGSFPHNGKMDEVRIWNYARSQVEIQSAIWDPLTGSENGLIGYWRLDVLEDLGINGDGADDILDYTDNNLHGDTDGTVLTDGAPLHLFTEIADNLVDVSSGNDVAWGDYDNDGDLDILLTGGSIPGGRLSEVYRNDGNDTFTDINAGLVGVEYNSVAWGDYDNDGDLDILLAGSNVAGNYLSEVYRNDGNDTFTAINAGLPGICDGSVAWGDYDNDGDQDILLATGLPYGVYISRIYRNDGNDTFTDIDAGLQGVGFCSVAWGDYDNDGDLDILLAGIYYDGSWHTISKVYRNDGDDTFTDINAGLVGVTNCSVAWGDYDNDGDLDILLSGYGSSPTTKI